MKLPSSKADTPSDAAPTFARVAAKPRKRQVSKRKSKPYKPRKPRLNEVLARETRKAERELGIKHRGGRPRIDPALLEARGYFEQNPHRRAQLEQRGIVVEKPEPLSTKNYAAVALQYAKDVTAGRVLAGKKVKLACERHLRDLERERSDAKYPYYFDVETANRICARIEQLPHIKGRWAAKGLKIVLEPWMCFVLCVPFGWKRHATKKRRYREIYLAVPRKNGKSTLAAAIGIVMLTDEEEHGPEVYAGATSEKQAWEVFGPARLMLQRSGKLMRQHNLEVWAKAIVRAPDNGRFWPLIGKPGDGASPSCAIVDEYHEHNTPELVDTMVTGMGARDQPLLLIITTSGVNLASPCYDKHLEAQKVLEGTLTNDELFAIIYDVDPEDDWTSPEAVKKANPNLGVSVDEGFLLQQQRQAMTNPAYQNRFKTKHLNLWCAASVAGINMHAWRQCADPKLTLDQFKGEMTWFALDLASKIDVCCFAQVFKRIVKGANHYYAFCRHYLPEDTIDEATTNQQSYRKWVTTQRLQATPGAEVDFDRIREDVFAYAAKFVVQEIVYDPWRATQLAHQLAKDGARVVEMGQTAKNMGEAYDELTAAIKSGRFHHDGDPVLEWMASNVVAKTVAKGLTLPSKEKREQKIDGIVAIIMALARAMVVETGGWLQDPIIAQG